MGIEYQKRLKEQYGRSAVVANASLVMGASLGAGGATGTALADPFGVATYKVDRPAKLDGVTVDIDGALGGGETITVNILVDGAPVGTVDLVAGDTSADAMFESELEAEVRLAADSILMLTVDKSATAGAVALSARAMLRLFEN